MDLAGAVPHLEGGQYGYIGMVVVGCKAIRVICCSGPMRDRVNIHGRPSSWMVISSYFTSIPCFSRSSDATQGRSDTR